MPLGTHAEDDEDEAAEMERLLERVKQRRKHLLGSGGVGAEDLNLRDLQQAKARRDRSAALDAQSRASLSLTRHQPLSNRLLFLSAQSLLAESNPRLVAFGVEHQQALDTLFR